MSFDSIRIQNDVIRPTIEFGGVITGRLLTAGFDGGEHLGHVRARRAGLRFRSFGGFLQIDDGHRFNSFIERTLHRSDRPGRVTGPASRHFLSNSVAKVRSFGSLATCFKNSSVM